MSRQALLEILQDAIEGMTLKKVIFSKPADKSVLRADARPIMLKSGLNIQLSRYMQDGKALFRNIPARSAPQELVDFFVDGFGQINVLTQSGECQAANKKGEVAIVINRIQKEQGERIPAPEAHNAQKAYLLPEAPARFLQELDIMDASGHVHDKRRAKFRQINRFLEYLRDAVDKFGISGELCVYDLCCGKGYLTFAAYYYLKEIRGLDVRVYGADRKPDVIARCGQVAKLCGFEGLHFTCEDIAQVRPAHKADIVLALHACDTATDIALAQAVKWDAGVILSAPCCQHELAGQIKIGADEVLLKQPLARYRFAQLLTDALRCRILEICGYAVQAVEFIDPDETDKNLLIRAVRLKKPIPDVKKQAMREELEKELSRYGASPSLAALLADRLA